MSPPAELPRLEVHPGAVRSPGPPDLGLVVGGGGARAAYQVGVLRCLARHFPELRIPYLTGVSAGAINAALLASHHGTFLQAVEELTHLWANLTVKDVFRVDSRSLLWTAFGWARQLFSGGMGRRSRVRGLVDTQPLREYLTEVLHAVDGRLTGVDYNLQHGRVRAAAISTSNYSTGQSITWVQGKGIEEWERPDRKARKSELTVEHVMASAALPILFPAVRLGDAWYGDGGIRLTAPLSPAVHLGARHILAISTRYQRTFEEAEEPSVYGYPPPAQVVGVLMNAVFLDLLDADAMRLDRLNQLLEELPAGKRAGLRLVDLLVLRPSMDLAQMANEYEPQLPRSFRFLTRGLGTKEIRSPDFLSLILFQPDYLTALISCGERDAEARLPEIRSFLQADE